jgi:hypothetical protein
VFGNEIAGNKTSGVIVVGFQREIKDLNYEALPIDIVVHDNIFGRNGWAPDFPGGPEIAKAVGGVLPPVVWDGAPAFTRAGSPQTRALNVNFRQGPVLNLRAPNAADRLAANPQVTATVDGKPVAEPKPVVLPPAQARLAP